MSYICIMKNNKNLWILLEKYDSDKNLSSFCDSISKIIQGIETQEDLINLIKFNEICESDMDILNKSIDLKSVLF